MTGFNFSTQEDFGSRASSSFGKVQGYQCCLLSEVEKGSFCTLKFTVNWPWPVAKGSQRLSLSSPHPSKANEWVKIKVNR